MSADTLPSLTIHTPAGDHIVHEQAIGGTAEEPVLLPWCAADGEELPCSTVREYVIAPAQRRAES